MDCVVMWGLSLAVINSLHHSIHPPKMEINLPKTVCGCPYGRVNTLENGHTYGPHPMECIHQCTIVYKGQLPVCSALESYSTNKNGVTFLSYAFKYITNA